MTTYYMHTLDGKPATFDGDQVCFATFYGPPNDLCRDLKQIRREQKASKKWRDAQGFKDRWRVGYIRVRLPQEPE